MTPQERYSLPRLGQVRRRIWLLLAAALFVAMALPLLALWRAASSPLQAEVCVWPPIPQAQEIIQVVVTLPRATDQEAVAGSWAHLQVEWDMTTMPMSTNPITLAGDQSHAGAFTIPLHMNMAGPWWVDLTLQAPGRPDWHSHFQMMVAPPGVAGTTHLSSSASEMPAPCHAESRSAHS